MQPETPSWKLKEIAARAAAIAAMTREERNARAAYRLRLIFTQKARRERRRQRRDTAAAEALLVNQRIALGDTREEIASLLGISLRSLLDRCRRWGHAIPPRRPGARAVQAVVRDDDTDALDALAADMQATRSEALAAIVSATLSDGAHVARRLLAVKRRAVA